MRENFKMSHFDLKLENIFLKNKNHAKLADFGFASRDEDLDIDRIIGIWGNRNK